ncbi:hypothetical protein [Streptomyces sp. KHY 26]|uniref:hypothetical protein n=1 Tax=Streptomyces sp. KHY 26 TaxID=3097359 RepID=UPI00376EED8C
MHAGSISPAVTQAALASTICHKGGYTKGIRPPQSVTGQEKRANATSYSYNGRLGLKDPVETKLHTAVCSGKVTLRAAQQAIVTDWTTALSKLGLMPSS